MCIGGLSACMFVCLVYVQKMALDPWLFQWRYRQLWIKPGLLSTESSRLPLSWMLLLFPFLSIFKRSIVFLQISAKYLEVEIPARIRKEKPVQNVCMYSSYTLSIFIFACLLGGELKCLKSFIAGNTSGEKMGWLSPPLKYSAPSLILDGLSTYRSSICSLRPEAQVSSSVCSFWDTSPSVPVNF